MPLDLEQHLQELCEEHKPALDLYDRLERVSRSAEKIWEVQRLTWFTDHRAATHSRSIIQHLGSVLEHLQSTSQKLTPYELYVLLAACYLHDIGMQDFSDPDKRGVDDFNNDDYERIRKDHPIRAREMIIARTLYRGRDDFRIDLDDHLPYLRPIAVISQGHGSTFFADTVIEARDLPHRPGNMPFRGDLLTALLLMGDELDLHEDRATFPPEFAQSPISLLHNHIHHYVASVEVIVGRTPKHRQIRLTMEYPQDSDDYGREVSQRIATKLRKQCKLTAPVLESCTQGELIWEEVIEIRETIDSDDARRSLLDPDRGISALHELKRESLETQTVNREELVEAMREALTQQERQNQIIEILEQADSDWGHLSKWLEATCSCLEIILVRIGFQLAVGHGAFDVLHRIHDSLTGAGVDCINYRAQLTSMSEHQEGTLDKLGQALLADLAACAEQKNVVLLFEQIDIAEEETARWLEDWILNKMPKQQAKILTIVTRLDTDSSIETINPSMQRFRLLPFSVTQIDHHLHSEFGLPPDQAEIDAKSMHGLSSGVPLRILTELSRRRAQGVRYYP